MERHQLLFLSFEQKSDIFPGSMKECKHASINNNSGLNLSRNLYVVSQRLLSANTVLPRLERPPRKALVSAAQLSGAQNARSFGLSASGAQIF